MAAVDFFAGCIGGAAGVLAGHPLDTVKVRLQIQSHGAKVYRGTWHCFRTIIEKEGFKGLYKDICPQNL
uniref:SLC25A22 n=1 Tax=Heterorhabditis bacteriophora TaxID=37862 RepID=A0A1I7XP13_HETBA